MLGKTLGNFEILSHTSCQGMKEISLDDTISKDRKIVLKSPLDLFENEMEKTPGIWEFVCMYKRILEL